MCVCMHAQVCVCVCMRMCAGVLYVCVQVYIHTYSMYVCAGGVCICVQACVCVCICYYVCVGMCMCVHACACMFCTDESLIHFFFPSFIYLFIIFSISIFN